MKKILVAILAAAMMLCMFAGCSSNDTDTDSSTDTGSTETTDTTDTESAGTVDLEGKYTLTDPEGVEYDTRTVLYMPYLESDEHYADGARECYVVIYAKDEAGVYMYSVDIFDTADNASAYCETAGEGTADGNVWVSAVDASFFEAMASFIPDAQTYVDNMMASGMVEVK